MPSTVTPGRRARASSWACSSRQGAHPEAKKLTSVTPLSRSFRDNPSAPSWRPGKVNSGAGRSINADGTRCGSWVRPMTNTATKPANTATGSRKASRRVIGEGQSSHRCRRCGGACRAPFLPMPALLQRVDDLARHVIFVVLGEHGRCGKDPVGAELALGDDPLSFAEEVRPQTLIDDR